MLDEIFEMFERDGKRGRAASERRGVRGFFARMFGGGDDADNSRRTHYDEDDDTRARYRDDEDDERRGRRRGRDHDRFDFGD